jgi:hypothetical protein
MINTFTFHNFIEDYSEYLFYWFMKIQDNGAGQIFTVVHSIK